MTGQAGRPEKEIDWRAFEKLCALQCTKNEICDILHCDPVTLDKHVLKYYGEDFSTSYKKFCSTGKMSLRRNQFILSQKNAAMAIWLGKQWLEQKDNSKETEQMLNTFTNLLSKIDNNSKNLVVQDD